MSSWNAKMSYASQVISHLLTKSGLMATASLPSGLNSPAELENIMSDYLPDSELMRLSARSGTRPRAVSPELFEVLEYAREVSRRSDGAFDVTVGPYVKLWRQARKTGVLPAGSALADARL